MRPTLGAALLAAAFALAASAQDAPKAVWTEADVAAAEKAFQADRAAASKSNPASLERSDDLAARAARLAKRQLYADAVRLYRDARFGLPPGDLPEHVVRVIGSPRLRLNNAVQAVALSPDASKVVGGSADGEIKVWDSGNGRELFSYAGHKNEIQALAWSNDGKWILSAAGSEAHLIDGSTGKLAHTLTGHTGVIRTVAFRPDSKVCATSGDDTTVRVYDVATGKVWDKLPPKLQFGVNDLTFDPTGKMFAFGDQSGLLGGYLLEPPEGRRALVLGTNAHNPTACTAVAWVGDGKTIFSIGSNLKILQHGAPGPDGESVNNTGVRVNGEFDLAAAGHVEPNVRMAVTPYGKNLLTAGREGPIRVWDVAGRRVVRTLPAHDGGTRALAVSADGRIVASGGADRRVRISELSLEDPRRVYSDHKGFVWAAVASSKGKHLASGGADHRVMLRDPETGKTLKAIDAHNSPVTVLAFSPDETLLASAGGDRVVKIWDAATGELKREIPQAHTAPVMALAWTGDGKRLLTGSVDRSAKVWDATTGKVVKEFSAWKTPVVAIAVSSDDAFAVFGGADGALRVVKLADYSEVQTLPAHSGGVNALTFAAKDLLASAGGDPAVKLWKLSDAGQLAESGRLEGHVTAATSLGVSPDGKLLVAGGADGPVRVWNLATKIETRSVRGQSDWVSGVQFVPGSSSIFSSSLDGTVSLWESAEEPEAEVAPSHQGRVNGVFPSKDGSKFVSCSDDGTARVWEAASGRLLSTLTLPGVQVRAAAFDGDGTHVFVGGSDRKLRTWDWKANKVVKEIDAEPAAGIVAPATGGLTAWLFKGGSNDTTWSQFARFDTDLTRKAAVKEEQKRAASAALSSDGLWGAIGSPDGSIRVWDIEKAERPLGGDLAAHADGVADLAFSADKKRLASASDTGEVKIWDLGKKEAAKTFAAHDKGPTADARIFACLTLSADGKRLLTAGLDGRVKLWDADSAKELRAWKLPIGPTGLTFAPDGKTALAAGGDGAITQLELP